MSELVDVVDRPVEDILVVGVVAGLGVLHRLGHGGQELVVYAPLGDDSGCCSAVLAGVEVTRGPDPLHRGLDIGVVEHQYRRLAAEFEVGPLHILGRRSRDRNAGSRGSGDRYHLRDRVRR